MANPGQATPDQHADLDKGISSPRFQTFLDAASQDLVLARRLYVWNRDLSVAFLADIAILEVALRNAMHDAATAVWGPHWYAESTVALDDRSASQLSSAWGHLHPSVKNRASDPDVPGRLIAQCMFGFWTNLLDAGGYYGKQPRRHTADYELHWNRAFKAAFPGGRNEARAQRAQITRAQSAGTASTTKLLEQTVFVRAWVHGICKNVNELRNRVAHHEPLINGFPLNGRDRRMTAAEAHEQCRLLARCLDRDLAGWIDRNTTVPTLLGTRPS